MEMILSMIDTVILRHWQSGQKVYGMDDGSYTYKTVNESNH